MAPRHRTVALVTAPRSEPVYRITAAGSSLSDDQRGRQRRYLISMSIRTVCFLAAIVVEGPLRWVLIMAALLLPYAAVGIAIVTTSAEYIRHGNGSAFVFWARTFIIVAMVARLLTSLVLNGMIVPSVLTV